MRGTLCKCKKVTYRGHVGHAVDAVRSGHSTQWMQYAVDAACSGIVVYGTGDIVFGAKRSNQWMQYAVHSGIVVYGSGDIVSFAKRSNRWTQWTQYAVDTVCSGIVVYGGGDNGIWCKEAKPVDAVK